MDNKSESASEEDFTSIVNMAKSLRREQLFILNEQNCFVSLHEIYEKHFCHALQV